jgi:hypothetical protein
VLVAGLSHPAAAQIRIVSGTLGDRCAEGQRDGTIHLAAACNGRRACRYRIDERAIGRPGDGCRRRYVARWRCGDDPRIREAAVMFVRDAAPRVTIRCGPRAKPGAASAPAEKPRPSRPGIRVTAATYGPGCGGSTGNVTSRLARACNGKHRCRHTLDRRDLTGLGSGCRQAGIAISWRCGSGGRTRSLRVATWAGRHRIVTLRCPPPLPQKGTILVKAGLYGARCGARGANKTVHLAAVCGGKRRCLYKIDRKVLGDPAPGCPKDYLAEWTCRGSNKVQREVVLPEASGKTVVLTCPSRSGGNDR